MYLHIHAVKNTTICQIVAVCNIQLHVSALYVDHHQVVRRTIKVTVQQEFGGDEISSYIISCGVSIGSKQRIYGLSRKEYWYSS